VSARSASLAPSRAAADAAPVEGRSDGRAAPAASLVGLGIGKAAPGSRIRAAKKGDITADLRRLGVEALPPAPGSAEPELLIPPADIADPPSAGGPASDPSVDADRRPDPGDESGPKGVAAPSLPYPSLPSPSLPSPSIPVPSIPVPSPFDLPAVEPPQPFGGRSLRPAAPLGWSADAGDPADDGFGEVAGEIAARLDRDGPDDGRHAAFAAFDALVAAWNGPPAEPALRDPAAADETHAGPDVAQPPRPADVDGTTAEGDGTEPVEIVEVDDGPQEGAGISQPEPEPDGAVGAEPVEEEPLLLGAEAQGAAAEPAAPGDGPTVAFEPETEPEPEPDPDPDPDPQIAPDPPGDREPRPAPAVNPVAGLRARIEAAVAAARRSEGASHDRTGHDRAEPMRKASPARRPVTAPERAAGATAARQARLTVRPPEDLIRHWVERRGRDALPAWEAFDARAISAQWPNTLLLTLDPNAATDGDAASAFAGIVRLDRADRPQPSGTPTIAYTPSLTDWILGLAREAARGARLARDADEFVTPAGRLSLSAVALPLGPPDGRVTQVLCHLSAA